MQHFHGLGGLTPRRWVHLPEGETQAHRAKGQGTHPPSQHSEVLPGQILSNVQPENSPGG